MSQESEFQQTDGKLRRRRKRRELALALPVLGIALLVTPVLDMIAGAGEGESITRTITMIFGIWALLILAAGAMAHFLREDEAQD